MVYHLLLFNLKCGISHTKIIETKHEMIIAGGYAKYPITIPIKTSTIVAMNIELLSRASCSAMFAGSDSFNALEVIIDIMAVAINNSPYRACGKNT